MRRFKIDDIVKMENGAEYLVLSVDGNWVQGSCLKSYATGLGISKVRRVISNEPLQFVRHMETEERKNLFVPKY